jgi:hypothetical protein
MGKLITTETPKETQSKAIAILRDEAPVLAQQALSFINDFIRSDNDSYRKDAHKLLALMINKAIPNTTVVQHEHNGAIDERFAEKLRKLSLKNNITEQAEVTIESVNEEQNKQAVESASERIFENPESQTIYNSLRESLGSEQKKDN